MVDLEKIKEGYAMEMMFKRNEELYEETNRLMRECGQYVTHGSSVGAGGFTNNSSRMN